MVKPFHYWMMPGIDGKGNFRLLPAAKVFFQHNFPDASMLSWTALDERLWAFWQRAIAQGDEETRRCAELCLRCRISHLCQENIFLLKREFLPEVSFADLFSRLACDDGSEITEQSAYQPLTLKILHEYNPNRQGTASLVRLVKLKVNQDPELASFLLEFDTVKRSDWSLLNRCTLRSLTPAEQQIIRVYRAVYQRDRRQQSGSHHAGRCPEPTQAQLQEMIQKLQFFGLSINDGLKLQAILKKVADHLRKEEVSRSKGYCSIDSLDIPQGDEQSPYEVKDLQTDGLYQTLEDELQEKEFQSLCNRWDFNKFYQKQLLTSLDKGVGQALRDRITFLATKPKRRNRIPLIEPALWLLYVEGLSTTTIATQLGLNSQPQLSQFLEPKQIVESVCDRLVGNLLKVMLSKAIELGFSEDPPEIDYYIQLTETITDLVNKSIKEVALKEISTSKNRTMNSLLAQRVRIYLYVNLYIMLALLSVKSLVVKQIALNLLIANRFLSGQMYYLLSQQIKNYLYVYMKSYITLVLLLVKSFTIKQIALNLLIANRFLSGQIPCDLNYFEENSNA